MASKTFTDLAVDNAPVNQAITANARFSIELQGSFEGSVILERQMASTGNFTPVLREADGKPIVLWMPSTMVLVNAEAATYRLRPVHLKYGPMIARVGAP